MGGSRLASVVTAEELAIITEDVSFDHWIGMYLDPDSPDYVVNGDGRELTHSYFESDLLYDSSSSCPDCTCIKIGRGGKLMLADCTETKRYICEFKGKVLLFTSLLLKNTKARS